MRQSLTSPAVEPSNGPKKVARDPQRTCRHVGLPKTSRRPSVLMLLPGDWRSGPTASVGQLLSATCRTVLVPMERGENVGAGLSSDMCCNRRTKILRQKP
jgi:hypothetical protein